MAKKKTGAMPCGVGNCFGIGNMGVSKHRGGFPPKWMVYFMEKPIKMDDLGGFTPIFGNTHMW